MHGTVHKMYVIVKVVNCSVYLQEYCEPQAYIPMLHKDHTDDLRHFRVKSKSWSAGEKSNSGLSRLSLRF